MDPEAELAEEALLLAEEPPDEVEVVTSVEAALEVVVEAPVPLVLEPEPDAAEEPELVKQLVATTIVLAFA